MRLDSSGNLGLGVTPSVQFSGIKSLQIGATTNLFDNGTSTKFYHNAFTAASGNETYITSGFAQGYLMPSNGQHQWYIAVSGTAGNTFSFTQAMTLDASGNLGIGTSSPQRRLSIANGGPVVEIDPAGTSGTDPIYFNYNRTTSTYLTPVHWALAHTWNVSGGTLGMILNSDMLYSYAGVNPSSNGAGNARIFNSSSGSGTVTLYIGNAAITAVSDLRLKENVVDSQRNALELVSQLRVVDHTWNDPSDQCENNRNSRGTWMGLIAQEAQPIIPWLVNKPTADVDENGDPQYWHMDYGYSVPLLIKAIQEQQAIITQLTARITALEGA
jgi:hypothetical protein